MHGSSKGPVPVGIAHDAVHEVVVHEAEARDRWSQVQVNHVLPRNAAQILGVAHPGEGVDDLVVPRQLVAIPAADMTTYSRHIICSACNLGEAVMPLQYHSYFSI